MTMLDVTVDEWTYETLKEFKAGDLALADSDSAHRPELLEAEDRA